MDSQKVFDTKTNKCVHPETFAAGGKIKISNSLDCCTTPISIKVYGAAWSIWVNKDNESYCIAVEGMPSGLDGKNLVLKEGTMYQKYKTIPYIQVCKIYYKITLRSNSLLSPLSN